MLCLTLPSYAALEWETVQITQKASPLVESISATFRFQNKGDKVVTIKEVKSSCGCTTTTLAKMTYKPGESGEIVAKLDIGSRQGLQSKPIQVFSDDRETPVTLMMHTQIPKLLDIPTTFVFWQKGLAPDAKTIDLTVGIEEPVRVVSAQSDNSSVAVQLDEVEPGKRYRLTVAPTSTDELVKARITLVTDFPKEKPRTFYLFAHVK